MEEHGIATRQGTHAPVLTSLYANRYDLDEEAFPRAVVAERMTLALPLYPDMTDADQELVVTELLGAFEAI
jgi:dTDP-4-amino-4,6-dideoxygalactose transaminase